MEVFPIVPASAKPLWSSRAVHIPTSDGYALLLSVADPEALLGALRSRQSR